jgi:hypothetical protein
MSNSKKDLTEVTAYINSISKQQRLPTNEGTFFFLHFLVLFGSTVSNFGAE